ncbi:MAG: hypothetical protein HY332_09790, partial [Chloroflexi bacterium]|nr:hypothetical protein [Chloroflexota bacterium]
MPLHHGIVRRPRNLQRAAQSVVGGLIPSERGLGQRQPLLAEYLAKGTAEREGERDAALEGCEALLPFATQVLHGTERMVAERERAAVA